MTTKYKAIDYYNHFVEGHHALPIEHSREIKKFKIGFHGKNNEISNLEIIFHRPDARAQTSPGNGPRGGRPRDPNPSPRALHDREYRERKRQETLAPSAEQPALTQTQT